jgi:phosphoglycolate phosphatase
MDGTLLNTLKLIAVSMNHALAARGLPTHRAASYRRFVGDGLANLVERSLPVDMRDGETIRLFIPEMRAVYAQEKEKGVPLYDGVRELLTELEKRCIPKAILSNKDERFTRLHAERDLAPFRFDAVIGARSDLPLKPAPDGALMAAHIMGKKPAEVLLIGDMAADIGAAKAAGMTAGAALWGFSTKKELSTAGAKIFLKHPLDALKLL